VAEGVVPWDCHDTRHRLHINTPNQQKSHSHAQVSPLFSYVLPYLPHSLLSCPNQSPRMPCPSQAPVCLPMTAAMPGCAGGVCKAEP
jgi:hypothetical protein